MKQGAIIDATLIAAPASTKKQGERDPEIYQPQKGTSGTAANVHDITAAELLHREETVVYADAGYQGIAKRPEMAGKAIKFVWP